MESELMRELRKKNLKYLVLNNSFSKQERFRAITEYFQLSYEQYKAESK